MKNFSDLLATNLHLDVVNNGANLIFGLHDHLVFNATDIVSIDGIEILPKYRYLAVDDRLTINEPFYCWYHRVSGQGWLLAPQ
jgi:hypothetical protein